MASTSGQRPSESISLSKPTSPSKEASKDREGFSSRPSSSAIRLSASYKAFAASGSALTAAGFSILLILRLYSTFPRRILEARRAWSLGSKPASCEGSEIEISKYLLLYDFI